MGQPTIPCEPAERNADSAPWHACPASRLQEPGIELLLERLGSYVLPVKQFVFGLLEVFDHAYGVLRRRSGHPAIDINHKSAVAEHLDKAAAIVGSTR